MLPSFVITTKRNETILGYCDFGKSQRSNFVVSTETGISFEDIFGSYENSHIGFFGKIFNKKRLQKIYAIITNKSLYDQSDLNIFLELYKELGIESFKYIEGPFAAFVIGKNNFKVFSSLNPTYPLYYYNSDGVFWLANEVKVFRVNPRVDLSLKDFDTKNNDIEQPANYTLFNKVQKISASSFLEFQNNGNEITINGKDYFKDARAEENASKKETINKLDHLFKQSIEDYIFLNNGKNISISLSGGIDSCLVAAYVKELDPQINIHTFTFGTSLANEFNYAKLCAEYIGASHHEILFDEQLFFEGLSKVMFFNETFHPKFVEVHATMFLVYQNASKYSKVLLGGFNADSLFGGLLNPNIEPNLVNQTLAQRLNRSGWTGEYNPYLAKNYGLYEASPYINNDFVRYASRISSEFKVHDKELKYILKILAQEKKLIPLDNIWRKKVRLEEGCASERMLGDFLGIKPGKYTRHEEYFIRGDFIYQVFKMIFEENILFNEIDFVAAKKKTSIRAH
jgi:asparagine synthetase B (glutamine-hydrolysing)